MFVLLKGYLNGELKDGIIGASRQGMIDMERKHCVLYERECIECGECNVCDLDPGKVCDNCGKCIGLGGEGAPAYLAIKVDGIIDENMNPDDYLYEEATLALDFAGAQQAPMSDAISLKDERDADDVPDGLDADEGMFPFVRGRMGGRLLH